MSGNQYFTRKTLDAGFMEEFSGICRAGAPLVKYLCRVLELPY